MKNLFFETALGGLAGWSWHTPHDEFPYMAQLLIKKANYISGYSEAETCGHSWSVMCHGSSHCQLAVTQRQAKPNNYCYS